MIYQVIQVFVPIVDILLVIHLYVVIFRHHLQQDNDILLLDHPMGVYIVSKFCLVNDLLNDFLLVYDVLTGTIERSLRVRNNHYGPGRDKCVRDVSWHPFDNYIISTSVRFYNIFLHINVQNHLLCFSGIIIELMYVGLIK
jgi:hypothetical protein